MKGNLGNVRTGTSGHGRPGADLVARAHCAAARMLARGRRALVRAHREEEGQGTTEYAILVGVLVVIAIVAIAAFRGRIQELWGSIADAVNGL